MGKSSEHYAIAFGFWFGNVVVKGIERIIPKFKNKEENLYNFKDTYLKRFNLSNKENLKRNLKLVTQIYFSFFFWLYAFIVLNSGINMLNLTHLYTLFWIVGIISFFILILFGYAAYKVSYN